MRLIDADRLTRPEILGKYYHLPNGDTAIPIIDIKNAPTVDAVPLDKLCEFLSNGVKGCPANPEGPNDQCLHPSCAECWKETIKKWMEGLDEISE